MEIIQLNIEDFSKCNNIWDMKKHSDLSERFFSELLSGNRITYVCKDGDEFIAEISLVKEMNDADYTIPNRRVYISHLVVRPEYRRQGIGKALVDFITEKAKALGYSEMSVGVDLDNYPALKLYIETGFNKALYIGTDGHGEYIKLVKELF